MALKNKKIALVRTLLEQPKTCIKQYSMKYGSAIHVAIANHEFKFALRILRMFKNVKDFNPAQDLNRLDEDGNSPLHILFRNFNADPELNRKIAISLIKKGARVNILNQSLLTPLH